MHSKKLFWKSAMYIAAKQAKYSCGYSNILAFGQPPWLKSSHAQVHARFVPKGLRSWHAVSIRWQIQYLPDRWDQTGMCDRRAHDWSVPLSLLNPNETKNPFSLWPTHDHSLSAKFQTGNHHLARDKHNSHQHWSTELKLPRTLKAESSDAKVERFAHSPEALDVAAVGRRVVEEGIVVASVRRSARLARTRAAAAPAPRVLPLLLRLALWTKKTMKKRVSSNQKITAWAQNTSPRVTHRCKPPQLHNSGRGDQCPQTEWCLNRPQDTSSSFEPRVWNKGLFFVWRIFCGLTSWLPRAFFSHAYADHSRTHS